MGDNGKRIFFFILFCCRNPTILVKEKAKVMLTKYWDCRNFLCFECLQSNALAPRYNGCDRDTKYV